MSPLVLLAQRQHAWVDDLILWLKCYGIEAGVDFNDNVYALTVSGTYLHFELSTWAVIVPGIGLMKFTDSGFKHRFKEE